MAHIEEPRAFFFARNRYVFEAILRLRNRREAIDYLTLNNELSAMGKLDEVGMAYIAGLINEVPTSIHAETYARQVASAYMRRRMIQAGRDIIQAGMETDKEEEDIAGAAEVALSKALARRQQTGYTFEQLAGRLYENIAFYLDHPEREYGLSCGIRAIDDIVQGMENGNMHVVAGATSIGKTSLMLSMALAMAFAGKRILFYSLEMTTEQLFARAAAIVSGINSRHLLRGKVTREQFSGVIFDAIEKLSQLPIIIEAPGSLTPATLKHQGMYYVRRHQTDAVFIDGLWLMSMSGSRSVGQDTSETGACSQGVKAAAKDLGVPIVIAHQLSRSLRDRSNKRPILTDLVDSSKVEQNSDVVIMLHRDAYWKAQADPNLEDASGIMEVDIAKNRNGPTGTAQIYYHRHLTYCTDVRGEEIR
jgi:replicative DNA helicase